MHLELPHLITVGMEEKSFRLAVQQNMDHLAGALKFVRDVAENAGPDYADIEEVIHSTETEGTDSNLREVLAEAGVGSEDGAAPPTPGNLRAQGGIGDWFFVLWDGVTNTSPVTYNVYADTVNGFAAAANTHVGTFRIPGGDEALGSLLVKQFPSTHRLPGHAVNSATTYYVRVSAADGDGESAVSSQVTVTPLKVDANTIVAAGTVVANLIGAGEIVAGHISSINLTVIQAVVGTLSAITANLGTINSGTLNAITINSSTINGSTIIGGTVKTVASGTRVELSGGSADVTFWNNLNQNMSAVGRSPGYLQLWSQDNIFVSSELGNITLAALGGIIKLDSVVDLLNHAVRNIADDALEFNNKYTAATAGTNGAPPGQVAGYGRVKLGGTSYKFPVYNL